METRLLRVLSAVAASLALSGCGGPDSSPESSNVSSPGVPPEKLGSAADLVPRRGEWPLAGVPKMAKNALARARKWQPDAILTSLEIELLPAQQSGDYIQTPEGKCSVVFMFCSPAMQKSLRVMPRSPGQEFYETRGVACPAEKAIEPEFLDLPEAFAKARDRGMQSRVPEQASLEVWAAGSRIGGLTPHGLSWLIRGSPQIDRQGFLIPCASSPYPRVRHILADVLVTPREAAAVLGSNIEQSEPHNVRPGKVWGVAYADRHNRQKRISLEIDEDPARDRRGFLERQARMRTPVAGLGDMAVVFDSPAGFAAVDVLVGDTLLQVNISGIPDDLEVGKRLAATAVDRLRAGKAVTELAPPQETIAGEWHAEIGGERLVLAIKKDGAWLLKVTAPGAPPEERKGYLDWDVNTLGRAIFVSPQGEIRFLHTATLRDNNTLETKDRGGGAAQTWTRRG